MHSKLHNKLLGSDEIVAVEVLGRKRAYVRVHAKLLLKHFDGARLAQAKAPIRSLEKRLGETFLLS